MSKLTLLCITEHGPHAEPFLTRLQADADVIGAEMVLFDGGRHRCLEDALEDAIGVCPNGYILRLDDDEQMTEAMVDWFESGDYEAFDHWAFPRLNLWPDASHYITNAPLYPDLQTRLSVKAKAGMRSQIHQGSPYGTGHVAPVAIEHHKFIARSREEREALVGRYDAIQEGAGRDFVMFSVPELYEEQLRCQPV